MFCLAQKDKALESYIRAEDIFEEIDNHNEKYQTYLHTVVYFMYEKQFNKALSELNKIDNYF